MRELYGSTKNSEIAAMLSERHGSNRTEQAVNMRARTLGLRKRDGYGKPQPAKFWTPERAEWLKAFTPGHSERETVDAFEKEFGVRPTLTSVKNAKQRFGLKSGTIGGRFEKGLTPFNKGRPWDEWMPEASREGCRRTQFKKGELCGIAAENVKPIGHERVSDGYLYVKVKDTPQRQVPGSFNDNFKLKHHVVWEEAHGMPVPPSTMIVFADHDKTNLDPDNLVAVPRSVWACIKRAKLDYSDRATLETAMAIAKLTSARYKLERTERPCRRCGEVFEPRHPNQRTCDVCLGRKVTA